VGRSIHRDAQRRALRSPLRRRRPRRSGHDGSAHPHGGRSPTGRRRHEIADGPATLGSRCGHGRPWHPDVTTKAFRRLVDTADVPRIRLHDVRHTHATHLLATGANVRIVSERLGHASVAFTVASSPSIPHGTSDVPVLTRSRSTPVPARLRPFGAIAQRGAGTGLNPPERSRSPCSTCVLHFPP
jgi:hypothetical protein